MTPLTLSNSSPAGILLINKPIGLNSFSLVSTLRKLFNVQKIGHAGTLDPFATGVMVMLVDKKYTRLSDQFLNHDKEYITTVHLGIETDSYDCDGLVIKTHDLIPTKEELNQALKNFQGEIAQIPPMFSAKKQKGKKLYELARQGITVDRPPVLVKMETELLEYHYPFVSLRVACSKGTYIRSIAHDLGVMLGCGAHLKTLQRTRSGPFHLADCFDGALLRSPDLNIQDLKKRLLEGIAKQ